ncbi:addiction module toxin RelE [Enterococcus sp. 669A]|uniref:Addiction module toxin RelE n=1 Tax=Candidatus Enterococcus moelleringii TaxID=2815325 RepID=A0ABS3L8G1_9ENTE|nr:addiction module toxin RelE [Enterococcus sp. 669A]MBO1305041.1 addiction module toxin RelE [Enterococcus sp. 669A]
MRYEIKLTKSSKRDLARLDNSQKDQILKSFVKIEQSGMSAGQQLHGKLKDCRKLKHKKLGLRVIFRESAIGIEIIEIVVVGKRADSEVYTLAEKRLGR